MNIVFNESDFGTPTLPRLLIDSITLYHGTVGVLNSKQDPHITHPDEMQAATIVEFENFQSEQFGDMNVVLDLRFLYPVKNNFGNANVLFNSELINYIDINVVQCRNREDADIVSRQPNRFLNPYNGLYRETANPDVADSIKNKFQFKSRDAGLLLSTQYATPYALISDALNKESFTAAGYADLGVSTTLPFEKITTNDGIEYYTIPFTMEFTIPASAGGTKADHLSYFAFCSINEEAILESPSNAGIISVLDKDFEVSITDGILSKIGMGPTFYDIVINNGEVYDKTFYFRDDKGSIYVGPTHQMLDGQWMKGQDHSDLSLGKAPPNTGYYLTQVPLPNIKIKDYRQSNKLQNYNFNFNKTADYIVNDESLLTFLEKTKTKSLLEKKNTSFFSNLIMSRDSNGANRFLFHIDMKEVMMANTLFPELLQSLEDTNPLEYKSLVKQALITDFRIIRTQVKREQIISNSGQNAVFSKYDIPHVVVISSDGPDGKLMTSRYDESKFYERLRSYNQPEMSLENAKSNAGTISEINLKNYTSSMRNIGKRTFTGVDYGVTSRNGGTFQYAVHLKIIDPVLEYIKKKRDIIKIAVDSMSPLVQDMSNPEFSDMYSKRFNKKAYDYYVNEYGEEFITSNIYEFLKAIYVLIPDNLPEVKQMDFLVGISHPSIGSIDGLLHVNTLMSDFVQKLDKVIASSMSIPKSLDFGSDIESGPYFVNSPNIVGSPTQKVYTLEHNFKQLFDNSIPPGFGYDFISLNKNDSINSRAFSANGLKIFQASKISQRFNLETQKLFNISDGSDAPLTFSLNQRGADGSSIVLNPADTVANKKYAYLSPSVVRFPNQGSFDSLANSSMNNSKLYALLMTDLYGTKQQGTAYQNATKENTYINNDAIDDDMDKNEQMHRMELISILEAKGGSIETKEGVIKASYSDEASDSQNKTTPFSNGTKFGFIDSETFVNPLASGDKDTLPIDLIASTLANYKTGVKDLLNTGINTNRLVNSLIMVDDFGMLNRYRTSLGTIFNGIEFYRLHTPDGGLTFKQEYYNAYDLSDMIYDTRGLTTPAGQMYSDGQKAAVLNVSMGLLGSAPRSQTAQAPPARYGTRGARSTTRTSPGSRQGVDMTRLTAPPASRTSDAPAPYQAPSLKEIAGVTSPVRGGFNTAGGISNIAQIIGGSYGSKQEQIFYPLKNAPNHVKALLLYGTSGRNTNILAKTNPILESLQNDQDPFRASDIYSYILMNYKVINKIEVFRGFGHSNCVQASQFSELTRDDLYEISYDVGELILCRQTKYLKKAYNVLDIDAVNIPLLDEYFLIKPENTNTELVAPQLPSGLIDALLNNKDIISNYLGANRGSAGYLGTFITQESRDPGSLGSNPDRVPHERFKDRNRARAASVVARLTGNPKPHAPRKESKYDSAVDPISTDRRDEMGRSRRSEPNVSDRRKVPRERGGY